MAQLLALEWDGSEARLVVASSRGDRTVIEQAFSVPLRTAKADDDQSVASPGVQIAEALSARGIGRLDTLVAVGRSHIELRQLAVPPAPEEELPELVRFQAMREFNEFDENWLLDYVPIDAPEERPSSVLAAAIGPEAVGQIQQTCQDAGLKPRRMILRPCAAASLLASSSPADPTRPRLLVDLLSDEADLTVVIDRGVVFLRTARISGNPLEDADCQGALLGEIRRTVAAAQNQLGGSPVDSIVLCGAGAQHAALAELLQEKLGTSTELFDPFSDLELDHQLRAELPERPGRFAPLLGMVQAELEEIPHAVDFLHPRRRPKPPGQEKKVVLIAMAVAVVVALFFGFRWQQRRWLADEIRSLKTESEDLDTLLALGDKAREAVQKIEKWRGTEVIWLDKLYELSRDFPMADQAMLSKLTLLPYAGGRGHLPGGEMLLEGLAVDERAIATMERALRDEPARRVEGKDSSEDVTAKPYTKRFNSSLYFPSENQ